jgi:hypothetical protein
VRSLAPVRLLAIAIALTGLIALSTPVAASAKQPCWKDIMDDWYPDESIDGSYSQACYRAADKNIPQDLRDYSDLPNEIARARMRDIRDSREETGSGRDRVPQSVGGAGPVDDRNDDGGGGGGSGGSGDSGGNPSDGAIGSALDALGPESADSAPIPLLVLAGLAMLLVAAGGAGLLTRRLQARRARVGGPPPGPQV